MTKACPVAPWSEFGHYCPLPQRSFCPECISSPKFVSNAHTFSLFLEVIMSSGSLFLRFIERHRRTPTHTTAERRLGILCVSRDRHVSSRLSLARASPLTPPHPTPVLPLLSLRSICLSLYLFLSIYFCLFLSIYLFHVSPSIYLFRYTFTHIYAVINL